MPKNLKQSRQNKKCLAMKKLNLEQMEETIAGSIGLMEGAGLMCGMAALFACSIVLAPIAVAPAIGCGASLAFYASIT